MRIGVMLRAYDRPGGIGIYSRNIIKHLLENDKKNNYFLFYNNKTHIGTYRGFDNANEIFVAETNQLVWDQFLIPKAIKKWDIDLIFNTKFSIPLTTKVKSIMTLHGASWYTNPEFYSKPDVFYVKTMMPIYCRKADFLISNSHLTTNDYIKYLNVNENKIATVHLAAGKKFKPVSDPKILSDVIIKYNLSDDFILTVTSYEDKRKNFKTLLKTFENCYKDLGIKLLVIGKNCENYINDFNLEEKGLLDFIRFPGWVDQKICLQYIL